ncbi:MAG: hypothetical protein V4667_00170 [Bacteroidota bacterium]
MSKINLNNYESYLLDYTEGTLSASDRVEMDLFLQQHPQILEQLLEFEEAPALPDLELQLPDSIKSNLKKDEFSISKIELDNLLIKELEADLTERESNILAKQLATNYFLKERQLIAATKLQADLNLIYPDKESLKKRSKIVPLFYYTSVAASLLIAFGSYYLFNAQQNEVGNTFNKKQIAFAEIKADKIENSSRIVNAIPQNVIIYKNNTKIVEAKTIELKPNRIALQTISTKPLESMVTVKNFDGLALMSTQEEKTNKISLPIQLASANNAGYLTVSEFINKKIKQAANKNQEKNSTIINEQKVNQYDIATLAVNAISTVSGMKLELEKSYTSEGELKEVALVGENFEFSRKK